MELKVGDKITYMYDNNELGEGFICHQGDIDFGEEKHYRWFNKDGDIDYIDLNDLDDVRRIKILGNIFT
ncbi:MAG: hypothetical protein COA52_00530 [Hyphomicrobiales bacterium]|nr:MAG: hypothetical protein COA52_00530 [Hyphomicrobiales bacterium]